MDVDLEPVIHRLVEREKEYIREDQEDYGCAMAVVASPEGIHLDFPKFDDEDSKRAAYEHLVRLAREKNATAIVTLNNAWTKSRRTGRYPSRRVELFKCEPMPSRNDFWPRNEN